LDTLDEFPSSLVVLRVAGTPYASTTPEYAQLAFDHLPHLKVRASIETTWRDGTVLAFIVICACHRGLWDCDDDDKMEDYKDTEEDKKEGGR
jgi:hypothetical protein